MEKDRIAHRILLTSPSPEQEISHMMAIIHDARNKLAIIIIDAECCQESLENMDLTHAISQLEAAMSKLNTISGHFREGGEIENYSRELETLKTTVSSFVPVFANLQIDDPDLSSARSDMIYAARAFSGLMVVASQSTRTQESSDKSEYINYSDMVTAIARSYQRRYPKVDFELKAEESLLGYCYTEKFKRAMENILNNAIEALPATGGRVILNVSKKQFSDSEAPFPEMYGGCYFSVEISDNGTGMSETVLSKASHHFRSTKKGGLGIGLTSVRQTVLSHGGHLVIESEEGQGTRVTTLIPSTIPPVSHERLKKPFRIQHEDEEKVKKA